MKFLILLLSALSCFAGVSPNALHIQSSIPYRFGPVAYYSPNSLQNTMNGAGMSLLKNLAPETRENWLLWSEDFTQVSWEVYGSAVKSGVQTITFAADPGSVCLQTAACLPLTGYTFSALAKAAAPRQVILLLWSDIGGTLISQAFSIGTDWTPISVSAVTQTAATVLQPNLLNDVAGTPGAVDFSQLSLRRATKSPAYVKTEAIRYVAEDRDLAQSTAASQPLVSRGDGCGNVVYYSEPLLANVISKSETVTQASFSEGGLVNGVGFPAAAQLDYAYCVSAPLDAAKPYTFSVFVVMNDNSAPTVGQPLDPLVDMTVVIGGALDLSPITIGHVSGNLYRISQTFSAAWVGNSAGIARYAGQSGKGFRITGYSLILSTWSPTYIATTSTPVYPGQNGQRVLVFDGTDDYMKTATFPFVQPETVMGVFEEVSYSTDGYYLDGFTYNSSALVEGYATQDTLYQYAGSFYGTVVPGLGIPRLCTTVFNSTTSSLQLDNTSAINGDAGASNGNGFTLGANANVSNFSNIRTSDLFLFDRVLTAPEQSCLVQWLGRRNGVNVW